MFVQRVCTLVLCAGTVLFCSTRAEASLELMLSDSAGGPVTTISDGGAGDSSPLLGQILFAGTVGTFDVVVQIGTSKPILGSASFPIMTLASTVTTTPVLHTALSTLTIKFTDTDFGPSLNPLGFVSNVNSASPSTQLSDLDTYIDLGNAAFGTTTLLSSLGPASGVFNLSDLATAATDPAYSLTMVATVTHGAGLGSSAWDASIFAVPEPVAFFVWGGLMGLGGMVAYRRRR